MYLTFSILLASIVILSFGRSVAGQATDPCNSPRSLGSAVKRSILNDPGTCDGRLCDNAIQEGVWYTLDGETTGNRMPESCVPVWRCGTYIPIWMNGAHPTEGSPGPVNVSVCAQHKFNGDCCAWRDQIRVKYCSSTALEVYYVYQLRIPPYCDMAYCGGSGIVCPQNWAWNEIKNNCTTPKFPTLPENPVLSSPYILDTKTVIDSNGNNFIARRFSVNCTFKYRRQTTGDDGARFDVIFEAGEKAIAKFTVTSSSAEEYVTVMDESYLAGNLDNFLRCKITSYWQSPYPARSTPQVSNRFYYGLQTLDSSGNVISAISVSEAQRVTIQVQATFPVTTLWCFNIPAGARCNPSYTFRIFSQKLLLSSCTFELSYSNPKSSSITLSPIPTPGTVIQPYNWPLYYQTNSNTQTDGSIFRGYKSSTINVNIIDALPQKSCSFTGDPHVYTFSSRRYDVYLVGDFYLARMTARQLEIQVRTIPCTTGGEISCTCGVMAREGNNIIGINNCGFQSPQLIRYLKDVSNPGGTIINSGSTWTIKLLSGVEVRVVTWGSRYFHVYVYGLGNEVYDGLCSYSGSQAPCDSDCGTDDRHRVPAGRSMFTYSSSNVPTCESSTPLLPSCDCLNGGSRSVPCYSPDQSNLVLMQYTCNTPRTRRKREAAQPRDETFFDIDLFASNMTFDRDFGKNPVNLVWPTPNRIFEENATEQCNAAVRRSPAYAFCTTRVNANISEIIRTCVLDIQISDELTFAEDSMASQLELLCQYKINVEAVETENSSDAEARTQEETLKTMLCDRQCSQNGDCNNGVCTCIPGFRGSACLLKEGQTPIVTGSLAPTCDIRAYGGNPCLQIVLEVDASDARMMCKIRNSAGYSYRDTSPSVNPAGQVTCTLQSSPVNSSDTSVNATTDYTIFVSVSYDGNVFSNEWQFIIYDSLCVSCSDRSCKPKPSSCSIRGRCYSADHSYQCTEDLLVYCKPNLCSTRWMTKNSGSCNYGFDACPSSTSKLTSVGILWLVFAASMTMIYRSYNQC